MALRTSERPSTDDSESEEPNAIDWTNSSDDLNPVDDFYKKKLGSHETAQELQNAENASSDNSVDGEDVGEQESNPDPVPSNQRKKGKTRFNRLQNAYKKGGPTAGIIGLIIGTFGLSSIILGPASLLVNVSDLLTNHSDNSKRLFVKTGKSYVRAFLTGQTRDCSGKIKCKFATISENRLKQWEKRNVKVVAEKTITGRYKVRYLEYKGHKITNVFDYKALRYTNPKFNSLLKRFPIKASYLNTKSTLNKSLTKFGKDIANKFVSSKDKEKEERKKQNTEKMNKQTGAEVGDNNKVTRAGVDKKAKGKIEAAAKAPSDKAKSVKKAFAVADGVSTAAVAACMYYDVVRAAQAATVIVWHSELIAFALPFLQAGAQAKEVGVNGGLNWETVEYFGDRLTTPVTQNDVDESPELYTQDMVGKTMMDSKGMGAALHGDHASLKDYAGHYTGWAPNVWGIGVINELQKNFGKDNIRNTCNGAKVANVLASVATCAASAPKCLAMASAFALVAKVWGDDIVEFLIKQIQEPALKAITEANLSDSLIGPPGGEALVGAAGVVASYQDRAAGFAAAGDDEQAYQAYNSTIHDEDYQKIKISEAKLAASKNQLDPKNPYSFVGQFSARIVTSQWDGSLFSVFSNMMHTVGMIPKIGTAYAAKEGAYMPIEIYNTRESFQGALDNCEDPGLRDVGIPCAGESGRPIPYILPVVEKCLDDEASGNARICIEEAIEYLKNKEYENDDGKKLPYIDGDTGKPSEFSSDKKDEINFKNPFLMFMRHCGADRAYPLGYTDQSIEEGKEKDDWYIGARCTAGKVKEYDEDLAWMSYYYNMCIALYASEEDIDYCWEESKAPTKTTSSGGDWMIPTSGPCLSPYGPRWGSLHAGIDLSSPAGTDIVAPADMTITFAGFNSGGYGNMVTGKATDGSEYSFRFGHMQSTPPVHTGDQVSKGTVIGNVGSTGDSTGPHLHFEVFPPGGNPATYSGAIDPVPVLAEQGVQVSC